MAPPLSIPNLEVRLSHQDLDLLMDLSLKGYRYLACRHLLLLGHFPEERSCQERMTCLHQAGLVLRLFLPIVTEERPREQVYTLARLGAQMLAQAKGISSNGLAGTARPSPLFLEHSLKIADFMCSLEAGLRQEGKAVLRSWQSEYVLKSLRRRTARVFHPTDRSQMLPVIPDGLFSLEVNGRLEHFFLEADRGTMGIESLRRKMLAYVGLFRQGLHQTAYGLPHFRVLIITTTTYRRDRLRAALRAIGYCQNMFLFAVWANVSPQTTLGQIWWRCRGDVPIGLF